MFANEVIARGVKFGPYEGKRVPASHVDEESDTRYMWEVRYTCSAIPLTKVAAVTADTYMIAHTTWIY